MTTPDASKKQHMSVVIVGHVDSGKSTTTGHLLYQLGGIDAREMEKLKKIAKDLGKDSFSFAFYTDTSKVERERGITIQCTTKQFHTPNYHYTIIDAPGHRDFMKNMISGASQADVGVIMVPADGNFATAIAKGDKKAGEVKGQTREHARLLNLLGCKQIIVCVNKMDEATANYREERYNEIRDEMISTLKRVGWKPDFVDKSVPIIPISGWVGDNLFTHSNKMSWWNGMDVVASDGSKVRVKTMHDALDLFAKPPTRLIDRPIRVPLGSIHNIRGVGDVVTGKIEQGTVKVGQEVVFLPSHTATKPCTGRVFSIEMHHQKVDAGECGFNVGMNIKGLDKDHMPRVGDIMIVKNDQTLKTPKTFTAQCSVLDHPGELKPGYCPVIHCRTAKSPCRMIRINWKMEKQGKSMVKVENPPFIKANEVAEIVFEVDAKHPIVVEKFDDCEVLARIAVMDGNEATMLGKVTNIEY